MKWLRTNLQHNITIPLSLLPIPRLTVPKPKPILKPIIIINHIVYTKGCHCLEDDVHAVDEESNQFFIFMLNIPQKTFLKKYSSKQMQIL